MLYEEAERRLGELRILEKHIEKAVQKYPEGKIHILQSGNRVQFYLRMDAKEKSGKYISKKEETKIKIYLQKKYLQEVLNQIKKETIVLEKFLKNTVENAVSEADALKGLYGKYPQKYRKYINPVDITDDAYIEIWKSEPYKAKRIQEDLPIFVTDNGEHVRSKSELNIANALKKNKIPYKYECPLKLSNGIIVHPDFTLLDVRRRRELYWEHRGMMDDRTYVKHAVEKQKEYLRSGIVFGVNLLVTEESSICPLGTDEIQAVINALL